MRTLCASQPVMRPGRKGKVLGRWSAAGLLRVAGLPTLDAPVLDPETELDLTRIAQECLDKRDGSPAAALPISLVQFLQWLALRRHVLFHGSPRGDLELLEPIRLSRDEKLFGDQQAVFASSDPVWAMYFALLRRGGEFRDTRNGSLAVAGAPLYPRRYFFSINQGALAEERFGPGSIYVVPREPFVAEPPQRGLLDTAQWAAATAVRPLFRLDVRPDDFPFVNLVFEHAPRESLVVTMLKAGAEARRNQRSSRR